MSVADVLVPTTLLAYPSTSAMSRLSLSRYSGDSDGGYSSPDDERVSSPTATVEDIHVEEDAPADDAALLDKVRKQVEWYFSDENLQKDSFLMKHITRNKQGYVSLKLVASLRKVKTLTKDWKVVLVSVQQSTSLQLNEECTKIRRLGAAPKIDFSHLPKTLLITNYHSSNPDEATVREEFGRYGNIERVLILHPGKAIPLDIKSCRSKYPVIGKELCLLVEYSTIKEAKKVCQDLSQNWRQTMSVQILSVDSSVEHGGSTITKDDTPVSKRSRQDRVSKLLETSKAKQQKGQIAETRGLKVSPTTYHKTARQKTPNGYDSGYTASRSPSLSPAPTRKFFSEMSTSGQSRLSLLKSTQGIQVTVLRGPYGPDGTNGFH